MALFSFFVLLLFSAVQYIVLTTTQFLSYLDFYAQFELFINPCVSLFQVTEMSVGIYSIYVSFNGLFRRRGFNKQVQQSMFKRQLAFVIIRMFEVLPNTLYVFFTHFLFFSNYKGNAHKSPMFSQYDSTLYSPIIFNLKGIIFFLLLCSDQTFRSLLAKRVIYFITFFKKGRAPSMISGNSSKKSEEFNILNSILSQSMNMELVCAILTGI